MYRFTVLLIVIVSFGVGCSTSRTAIVINDYHFEFTDPGSVDVSTWPVVHAFDHELEVRDHRILLNGADHGPIAPRQVIRLNSRGELSVDRVDRKPVIASNP